MITVYLDCLIKADDDKEYARVKFGDDGNWELILMDDYVKKLQELTNPTLSTVHNHAKS
jgi:hypothetical protein